MDACCCHAEKSSPLVHHQLHAVCCNVMTSLNMLIYYTHCYYTFASKNECNGEYELQMHLKRGHVCVSVSH